MGAFKKWLTAPVQLDRKSASAAVRSVSNMESQSYMFLGYVHSFEAWPAPPWSASCTWTTLLPT